MPESPLILVAEDEEVLRELAVDVLQTLGYRVLQAEDGEQAVRIYKQHHTEIALVMVDMVMPNLDGPATFLKLKEINPGVRAILTTGYTQDGRAQEALDSGMAGFIQKPYGLEEVAEAVKAVLG